jgi:8-amino-3,8-dideoxy-alpha-D-manno-octulosonate transaminase
MRIGKPSDRTTAPAPLPLRVVPAPVLGAALLGREEEELVLEVLRSRSLFRYYGPNPAAPPRMVATLEREFAALIGTRFALGVTSGTAALEVALGALGVGPGDDVIVPAWSWVSCFTAVVRVGARPLLAEIDDTLCLAPGEIRRVATPRTKAVMVVHFQGVAADLDPILAEARAAGIAVIEDCAESPGAWYRGRRVGSIGDIGTFSFQQQKSLTSGEGGLVATSDPRLHERAVRMHDLGQFRDFHAAQTEPREVMFCGDQFRMSELTAAVALAQLRKLEGIRQHCRRMSLRLRAQIAELPGITLRRIPDPEGESGFETYFWVESVAARDAFRARLREARIPCDQMTGTYVQYRRAYVASGLAHAPGASPFAVGPGWPAPGYRAEDFPQTEDLIHRFVTIPVGVNHTEADMDYIAAVIGEVGKTRKTRKTGKTRKTRKTRKTGKTGKTGKTRKTRKTGEAGLRE